MSQMDDIVKVTVTRETRAPSQRGFGVPLIVAYTDKFSARVLEVSDHTELLDAGFSADSFLYRAVATMKAQTPSPDRIKIGRRSSAFTQVVHLIPTVVDEGHEYVVTVDGASYKYTVASGDTVEDIVDELVAAMAAAPGLTVTDADTHAVVTSDASGIVHSFRAGDGLDLFDATSDPGLASDLAAIRAADDDWYGLLIDSNSKAEISALGVFAESEMVLALAQSADWNVKDPNEEDDVASTMQLASLTRTGGLYHGQIGSHAAAAWMAKELPKNPGTSTWAHKTLALVDPDKLTSGERSAIQKKNWSHYTRVGGQNIAFEGKTPAGEFLDIMHQVDFSTARIQEAVFGTLTGNDKIPQTDAGIMMVRGAVLTTLKLCSSASYPIFDPESLSVRELTMADVPQPDRANRILRGVRYSARLTGAFHRVVIDGTVYV